ncbi:MAG: ABC transporter ATP-binding protein, partial [Oscillospiraceae bacterium]|nr:ABC transporter ATP-binding protein [Oscillospiraceae bacterium]
MDKEEKVLSKVLRRLRPYWALLVGTILLAGVNVAIGLYIPILVGRAIDHIVGPGAVDMGAVADELVAVLICVGISGVAQWIMTELSQRVTYRVTRDIRDEAFAHIQRLPLSYLDRHPHGDLVSRVVADVDTFGDGLLMGFAQLFTGVMTILGTLILMLVIRWQIALVVVVLTPLSLVVAKFISGKTFCYDLKTVSCRSPDLHIPNHNSTVFSNDIDAVSAFFDNERRGADRRLFLYIFIEEQHCYKTTGQQLLCTVAELCPKRNRICSSMNLVVDPINRDTFRGDGFICKLNFNKGIFPDS